MASQWLMPRLTMVRLAALLQAWPGINRMLMSRTLMSASRMAL